MRRIGEILGILDLQGQNKELLDELVKLSTTHGILTPYTSFLADENTVLTDASSNRGLAEVQLNQLYRHSGGFSGVQQRGANEEMRRSLQVAQKSRFPGGMDGSSGGGMGMSPATLPAQGGLGGMGGGGARGYHGFSGGMGGGAPAPVADAETAPEERVQTINNRAFFKKADGWVDGTLTAEQQKPANVITVKQFSDEYFKLIDKHGKELSQYLVFDEPVLVNFDNQAYNFVP